MRITKNVCIDGVEVLKVADIDESDIIDLDYLGENTFHLTLSATYFNELKKLSSLNDWLFKNKYEVLISKGEL